MEKSKQIRFCGFGGQGIILGGKILGRASTSAGKCVAGLGTYGGAARGGDCESDIVISDEAIVFPEVMQADILIAMSQSSYNKNVKAVKPRTGMVIYDKQLVAPQKVSGLKQTGIPATGAAIRELNNKQVANIILLGATVEITNLISKDILIQAIRNEVRERFVDLNVKAVDLGFRLGKEAINVAK